MVVLARLINSTMNPIWCRIYMRGYIDFSVYKGYLSKKKRESKFQKRKWTPISLNDENLVLINRNFSAICQLHKPFIAIVINDDAVAMTFPRKQSRVSTSK